MICCPSTLSLVSDCDVFFIELFVLSVYDWQFSGLEPRIFLNDSHDREKWPEVANAVMKLQVT
jgi:hypothetical protein